MSDSLAISSTINPQHVVDGYKRLAPEVIWCHHFELPGGVETVTPAQEPYFTKAMGLRKIGRQLLESIPYHCRKKDLREISVLDLACGEGCHAIEFAKADCHEVVGVDARKLYVDRASFVADALGLRSVRFEQGDVRSWVGPGKRFDVVLFLGILHHLAPSDFEPMLRRLHSLTADTLLLYTHVDEREGLPQKAAAKLEKFKKRLSDVIEIDGTYQGRTYLEHPEHLTAAQKESRMRSSIDNNYSFWAKESSLITGLKRAGFANISRLAHPNPFGEPAREFRVLYICRA